MVTATYLYGLKHIYPFISVITTKNLTLVQPKRKGYNKQLLSVMRSGVKQPFSRVNVTLKEKLFQQE